MPPDDPKTTQDPVPPVTPAGEVAPPASGSAPAAASADSSVADSGAGGQGETDTSASATGEVPPVPPAAEALPAEIVAKLQKEDWREAKIRRLTAKLHELAPKAEETTPTVTGTADPVTRLNESEIERRAQELSRQNIAIDTFNRMCNDAAQLGRRNFTDFDSRVSALRQLSGGPEDLQQQIAYNQFIAAALETGAAPALLHALGGDLDEAARIMALSPVRMAVELTRMAAKAPDTSRTQAPKPITPVGGRGAQHTSIAPDDPDRADKLTTSEWMNRRNAQEKAHREARGR